MGEVPSVALPETRQLDILAQLLERRGVAVLRCPLVAIADSPDPDVVLAWIRRLAAEPPALLLIYTGEGIRRLTGFADRGGIRDLFVDALAATPILTRGPKPVRALRDLGLKPTHRAEQPTTAGVIETLAGLDIDGRRVAVQLYGSDPNERLMTYLASRNVEADCVAPYVYASKSDDAAVVELIDALRTARVDAIAFTSKAQVERLFDVAERKALTNVLETALEQRIVAAVGPVVAAELEAHRVAVDVLPESDYFMKPLVTRLLERFAEA